MFLSLKEHRLKVFEVRVLRVELVINNKDLWCNTYIHLHIYKIM